jgi:hypothetical protein
MSYPKSHGVTPPAPGLEKEEPELGFEEDIGSQDDAPSDDGARPRADDSAPEKRPLRHVERE